MKSNLLLAVAAVDVAAARRVRRVGAAPMTLEGSEAVSIRTTCALHCQPRILQNLLWLTVVLFFFFFCFGIWIFSMLLQFLATKKIPICYGPQFNSFINQIVSLIS